MMLMNDNVTSAQMMNRNFGDVKALAFRLYFFLYEQSLKCNLVWPEVIKCSKTSYIVKITAYLKKEYHSSISIKS